VADQRERQPVLAQAQPDPAGRAAHREPLEDRGDDAGDGLVGVAPDPPGRVVGGVPDQTDRQRAAQFAAGGLVARRRFAAEGLPLMPR
jgi:hypothetical protein